MAAPRSARWRMAAAVTALVLLAHAGLLGGWPAAPGPGPRPGPERPLRVRQIAVPAPAAAIAQSRPSVPATRPTPPPVHPGAVAQSRVAGPVAASPSPAAPRPEAEADVESPSAPAAVPDAVVPPVYATRLPPPVLLQYALQRNGSSGRAELRWQVDQGRYRLSLQSELPGARGPGSTSEGGLDDHGLAPDRHTDRRRGRDVRAVNFQRDSGRITFSGPRGELPLLAGAQDRLSWMLQLAAIVEADPALQREGSTVSIYVVGSRGDAELWRFNVDGREALDLPIGTVADALRLRREPARPYDTAVEVWLDPARHHLPVRTRLQVQPTGGGTEFLLAAIEAP